MPGRFHLPVGGGGPGDALLRRLHEVDYLQGPVLQFVAPGLHGGYLVLEAGKLLGVGYLAAVKLLLGGGDFAEEVVHLRLGVTVPVPELIELVLFGGEMALSGVQRGTVAEPGGLLGQRLLGGLNFGVELLQLVELTGNGHVYLCCHSITAGEVIAI